MRTVAVFVAIGAVLCAVCSANATPGNRAHAPALQTPRKSAYLSQVAAIRAGDDKAVRRSSSGAVSKPRSLLRTLLAILERMPFIGGFFRQRAQPRSSRLLQKAPKRSASSSGLYRIQQELKEFMENPPEGCSVSVGSNLRVWIVTITGAPNTVFAGEKYRLKFTFPPEYPRKPPIVYFLQPTPKHEHVYTNGDICLDLLGDGWRPSLTASALAVSILSMLSSAKTKMLPPDNANHADKPPGNAQNQWIYHDDSC